MFDETKKIINPRDVLLVYEDKDGQRFVCDETLEEKIKCAVLYEVESVKHPWNWFRDYIWTNYIDHPEKNVYGAVLYLNGDMKGNKEVFLFNTQNERFKGSNCDIVEKMFLGNKELPVYTNSKIEFDAWDKKIKTKIDFLKKNQMYSINDIEKAVEEHNLEVERNKREKAEEIAENQAAEEAFF